MRLAIHQFGYNDDNYGVLLHDPQSGETALVDAGDAAASEAALADLGWPLTQIWITHHHGAVSYTHLTLPTKRIV